LKQRGKKALSQIEKLARSGLDEARRSVQALRPRALDEGTLPEALAQLAAQITKDAKLVCQFTQRGTTLTLSTEVQDELFRIAQEAMTNVRKHAHAKSARINLESKSNRVGFACPNGTRAWLTTAPCCVGSRVQHFRSRTRETLIVPNASNRLVAGQHTSFVCLL
jgi:glucose-6-phosphate-specific signal transduction histidine kinase